MKYSEGFRNSVLRKVLPPNNRSVASVAREYGISSLTIHNWLSRIKEGKLDVTHESLELPPGRRWWLLFPKRRIKRLGCIGATIAGKKAIYRMAARGQPDIFPGN